MKVKEAWELIRATDKRLAEKKENLITLRLGPLLMKQVDDFIKPINMSRSRFVRFCVGFMADYYGQLNEEEKIKLVYSMMQYD